MPELSYDLKFAGVPFCLDKGQLVCVDFEENQDPDVAPMIAKNRPLPDLIDEIDRLLPFRYFRDFSYGVNMPGRTQGALAFKSQINAEQAPDELRIGDYYYPATCSRWSVFRGLATSSMVKAMLAETQGYLAKTFTMKAVPIKPGTSPADADYTITTDLFMLPPRPLGELGGAFDGLYLVTLVDERFYMAGDPVTLHPTQSTSWENLIDALATALGITVSYEAVEEVYSQPEPDSQLWANQDNAALLLDSVAYCLGRCVVRNFDGTYQLISWQDSSTRALTNRGAASSVVRVAGGDLYTSGTRLPVGNLGKARNSVVPTNVYVTFPKYVTGDDPVPHFLNPRYADPRPTAWWEDSYGEVWTVDVPIASGGTLVSGSSFHGTYVQTVRDTAKALYPTEAEATGSPTNASGLTALALQVASDYYQHQVIQHFDESYPGTYKWTPEGLHDIVWTWSARAGMAACRVFRPEFNNYPTEMQHRLGSVAAGVGGKSVAQTWQATGGAPVPGVNFVKLGTGLSLETGPWRSGGVQGVTVSASGIGPGSIASGAIGSGAISSGAVNQFNLTVINWDVFIQNITNILALLSGQIVSGSVASGALGYCYAEVVTNVCPVYSGNSGYVTGIQVEKTPFWFAKPPWIGCPPASGTAYCLTNPNYCCSGTYQPPVASGCTDDACRFCTSGTPTGYAVTGVFSGNCSGYDGTFILPRLSGGAPPNQCLWGVARSGIGVDLTWLGAPEGGKYVRVRYEAESGAGVGGTAIYVSDFTSGCCETVELHSDGTGGCELAPLTISITPVSGCCPTPAGSGLLLSSGCCSGVVVPDNLYISLTTIGPPGDCNGCYDGTYTLTRSGLIWAYSGAPAACGGNILSIRMQCVPAAALSGGWIWQINGSGNVLSGGPIGDTVSCDPFQVEWNSSLDVGGGINSIISSPSGTCSGIDGATVTGIVTESPP